MYLDDTIVAAATPAGRGAIAIIRLSGREAVTIVDALWRPRRASLSRPGLLRLGEIRDPATGALLDHAMCVIFRTPHSATGEDVAELHCHGGPYLTRRIIGLAAERGARIAEPGEFTRRAYLNGRIDLTAAEAIADLIDARGERALTQAAAQLGGALAARVAGLRERLIAIRAHLESQIDFGEELEPRSRDALVDDVEQLASEIGVLLDTFARGRLARAGVRVAITGKPNAGKSSLLNLLLGAERAIVTAIPGTTRDVIEDTVSLGPYALVMQDTAGLRESAGEVERIGIERAEKSVTAADLVLAVFDRSRRLDSDDARTIALTAKKPGVALLNKSDLARSISPERLRASGCALPIMDFSATTGAGLEALRAHLLDSIERLAESVTPPNDNPAISRERHRAALTRSLDALRASRAALVAGLPPELIAIDLTIAMEALAALTGVISTEDVLDAIFREFCIGK